MADNQTNEVRGEPGPADTTNPTAGPADDLATSAGAAPPAMGGQRRAGRATTGTAGTSMPSPAAGSASPSPGRPRTNVMNQPSEAQRQNAHASYRTRRPG